MKVPAETVALIVLVLVGAAGGVLIAVRAVEAAPPDFTIPTTDNQTFTLREHRGEIVVLDLFATWCAPCRIVEGNLKQVQPEWNATGVRIVSIGVEPTETLEDLRRYQAEHNISWTVARDTDGVTQKYNSFEVPRVIILDREGQAVFSRSGVVSADELRRAVAETAAGSRGSIGIVQYGLLGLAMVAGAAAFFAPCAVGMLPSYVAYAVQSSAAGGRATRTLTLGATAALGVLLVFFGVGGLALLAGPAVTRYVPFLQPLVGFLLVAFGILLLARPYSQALQRWTLPIQGWASDIQAQGARPRAFFAYGIAYGAASAGCTTPVLLSVMVTAAAYGSLIGSGIVAAYALTGAFFMVVVTLAAATFRQSLGPFLGRASRWVEAASALVFIGGGLFLILYAARAGTFAA